MILDPSFVIGIAGDDPVGGLINLQAMWDHCNSADELKAAIEADGDSRREYLLLTAEGDVFRYQEHWTERRSFGWIGDQKTKQLHDPDPFDFNISTEDEATKRAHADWARAQGISEREIEFCLSGQAAAEIGPEMAQLIAMRSAGPEVSSFMIEARLVDGRFKFSRQSIVRVLMSPVLRSEGDVLRALFGDAVSVSHYTYSASEQFPAALAIEFLGARITFVPCRNLGYSHRIDFLEVNSQPTLARW